MLSHCQVFVHTAAPAHCHPPPHSTPSPTNHSSLMAPDLFAGQGQCLFLLLSLYRAPSSVKAAAVSKSLLID